MTFCSCCPGIGNKYLIQNNTESSLKVEFILNYLYRNSNEKDSTHIVTLKPNTQTQIIEYFEIGTAHDKRNEFLQALDTIIITGERGTLIKNIYDRENWEYSVLNEALFSDEVQYKLILIRNDFE